VREYKKNVLAPASGNTGDYNMEVLRDPPQVSNPGTPPGNTSSYLELFWHVGHSSLSYTILMHTVFVLKVMYSRMV
jgi:hypothetical protein